MITNIERRTNIINEAYKLGYKFENEELAKYNDEAVEILKEAEIEAIEGSTKEALITNLLEINDNGLESELYVLEDVEIDAEAYLCENAPIYDYSEVDFSWGYNQDLQWGDEFGYWLHESGNIVDEYMTKNRRYFKNDKGDWQHREFGMYDDDVIFIEKRCDSLGRVIQLYC